MKKLFQLFMLSIMVLAPLSSCNDDSDKPDFIIDPALIIGTWESTTVEINDVMTNVDKNSTNYFTMTFYSDGRFYGTGYLMDGWNWGSYVINGDDVMVLYDGAIKLTLDFDIFTDKAASLSIESGNLDIDAHIAKTQSSGLIKP